MSSFTIFSIDWGDTIGYSVIDNQSNILLIGNTLDQVYAKNQLELCAQYYNNLYLVMEKQIGVKTERYSTFIGQLKEICLTFNVQIDYVLPHIWKNSYAKNLKIVLSKHSNDSARMGMYSLNRLILLNNGKDKN